MYMCSEFCIESREILLERYQRKELRSGHLLAIVRKFIFSWLYNSEISNELYIDHCLYVHKIINCSMMRQLL